MTKYECSELLDDLLQCAIGCGHSPSHAVLGGRNRMKELADKVLAEMVKAPRPTRTEACAILNRVKEGIIDDARDDAITAMAGIPGAAWNRAKGGIRTHPDAAHDASLGCNSCDYLNRTTPDSHKAGCMCSLCSSQESPPNRAIVTPVVGTQVRWVVTININDMPREELSAPLRWYLDAMRPPAPHTPNAPSVDGPGRQIEQLRVGMDDVEFLPDVSAMTVSRMVYRLDGVLQVELGPERWWHSEDLRGKLKAAGWRPLP